MFSFNFKVVKDNEQFLKLLGIFGNGKRASSITLVVHTPQPLVVVLLLEWLPTKRRGGPMNIKVKLGMLVLYTSS